MTSALRCPKFLLLDPLVAGLLLHKLDFCYRQNDVLIAVVSHADPVQGADMRCAGRLWGRPILSRGDSVTSP